MRGSRIVCWMMVIAVAVGLCVGCEAFKPKPPTPPPPTNGEAKLQDVSGDWRVTWKVVPAGPPRLDFDLDLEQDDDGDLEGSANASGLAWDVEGEVEDDGEIELTLEVPGLTMEFEGDIVSATKIEGEWKELPPGASGTFEAFKVD